MKTKIKVFRGDGKEQWYWHAVRGSNVVATGGEGYKRKAALYRSLTRFLTSIKEANYEFKE